MEGLLLGEGVDTQHLTQARVVRPANEGRRHLWDPNKHALTQSIPRPASVHSCSRQRGLCTERSPICRRTLRTTPSQTTSRERTQLFKTTRPVDRMYNLHAVEGLLLGEGCQHATSATQTKAVRPANEHGHQHLSRPWQVTARRTNFLATRAAPKDCVQKQHVLICVKASHKPCLKA